MEHKLGDIGPPAPVIENRAGLNETVERLETVEKLQQQVSGIGIESDVRLAIANNIQNGTDRFNLSLETERNGDKLGIKLHFIKNDADFVFTGYDAALLHHKPMADGQINGVDIRELDQRMRKADWYYGIAESEKNVLSGFKETEAIEADLRQLSGDKQGAMIAAQLWNNHVPVNTVGKPDFIAQVEVTHDLYPKSSFPAEMTIGEAWHILKAEHQEQQRTQERATTQSEFAFYETNPGEIKQHLQQLQADGNKYVAYMEDAVPMTKENLHGCKNTFDAMEFAYENTTDLDRCAFSPIRHMQDAVQKWERLSEKDVGLSAIDQKMAAADWHYNRQSPTKQHWEESEAKMGEIQKDLVLLCKFPGGAEKANAFWDKYAPPGTVSKPYFLSENTGLTLGLVQGKDVLPSDPQLNDSKHLTAASQDNQAISKIEKPAKELKHKHRRRLQ